MHFFRLFHDPVITSFTYVKNRHNDSIVFFLDVGMELISEDNQSIAHDKANDILDTCRLQALDSLANDPDDVVSSIEQLIECAETNVARMIKKSNEEVTFQATVREKMGDLLENYTCADFSLETTEAIEIKTWNYKGNKYTSHMMHERKNSKIYMVEDFITEDECKAMNDAASHKLHQATVADTDGGSRLTESRKAKQAGIKVPWNKELFGNHIATLSRRVFDYTNYVTNFKLQEHGQEDLMFIQYEGRGEDDPEPDRYMPHCDGDCVGRPHRKGTRVASMVMYCEVPEKGGSTNFRNAGIHIVPKVGNAVFFSYMGNDQIMDKGFTEHSGCPVLIGGKKIVTQWMRKGVDNKNPWDSWNTMGVKFSDMNN